MYERVNGQQYFPLINASNKLHNRTPRYTGINGAAYMQQLHLLYKNSVVTSPSSTLRVTFHILLRIPDYNDFAEELRREKKIRIIHQKYENRELRRTQKSWDIRVYYTIHAQYKSYLYSCTEDHGADLWVLGDGVDSVVNLIPK